MKSSEFDLIKKYFEPLTPKGAPAFSLSNDAATFSPPANKDLVFTKDALVAGIHFFENDPPDLIAQKALRVNLSDLAAMGADPMGYLLSIALPKQNFDIDQWLSSFSQGLMENQKEFLWQLWGGDTVSTTGPITISVTAIGHVKRGQHLTRSGASFGDSIYISGSLGDSAAGLVLLQKKNDAVEYAELISKYHTPMPRIKLGKAISEIATSLMDVSDGLIADLNHICIQSKVGANINLHKLPISSSFEKFIESNLLETKHDYSQLICCGGDDYELLFTTSEENDTVVENISNKLGIKLTKIGKITAGDKAMLYDENGRLISFPDTGFHHF